MKINREKMSFVGNQYCICFFFFFHQDLSAIPLRRTNTSIACMAANYMIATDYIYIVARNEFPRLFVYIHTFMTTEASVQSVYILYIVNH